MAPAVANQAFALAEQHRFDEAFAFYAKSLAIEDNPWTRWNLALFQLLTGDFEAGWAGREAALAGQCPGRSQVYRSRSGSGDEVH